MPRIRHRSFDCSPGCTVEGTLNLIDGKWKGVVLYHLFESTLRFSEIRRRLPNVTQRMLTNQRSRPGATRTSISHRVET